MHIMDTEIESTQLPPAPIIEFPSPGAIVRNPVTIRGTGLGDWWVEITSLPVTGVGPILYVRVGPDEKWEKTVVLDIRKYSVMGVQDYNRQRSETTPILDFEVVG
jgi:hypothetical protein